MPYRLRLRQQQQNMRRRSRQSHAARNCHLRVFGRLNRLFGPPRRLTHLQRGLLLYPLIKHLAPPIPREISEGEFYSSIAHQGSEVTGWRGYHAWAENRSSVGDTMEYQFRRQFSIPVHLPRPAMKRIFLFLAPEGSDEPFSGEDPWFIAPEPVPFEWPRPFVWPLPWLD